MNAYSETNTLIQLSNVHLYLDGNHILDGVELELKDIVQEGATRGQIRCILGPSGIGKTQLMRIISGLSQPNQGSARIAVDGVQLKDVQAGMVGVVAQDYPLFAHLTVLDNLILGATSAGIDKASAKVRATELLERFDLIDRALFWPAQLSGGQRQRIAILQQAIGDRLFLIMDEPFSGLDPAALRDVIHLIRELASMHEHTTILIVTHDIRAAVQVAERLHILGRSFDAQGNLTRGAHFIHTIDLLEKGIAWQDNIRKMPQFNETVNYIEDQFETI